ncbi:hypothetical protein [Sphaerisporangium corydalis]|uniref:Transcriptional regulator n=1 Tax=Sphaerisporangium corydalis TaxID=1441875 RepID=A0ABV9ETE1_9ACTN|nr:hypothetical protein [Sphaerisporangium corydalis]
MWEESFYQLATAAARQQGMITAAQAARLGVDGAALTGLSQARLIMQLDWGVYELAGASLGPMYGYPYAAWLALSPELFRWERPERPERDAVLSHESACRLHGLGSVPAPLMVFTAPDELRSPRAVKVHVASLAAGEIEVVKGTPVTTPHRTILDLVRDWTNPNDVRSAVTEAVRGDLVDLRALHADLAPLADRHEFPADGLGFVRYFLPDLPPGHLSTRNLRALADLVSGDTVAEARRLLEPVVAAMRAAIPTTNGGGDGEDELARDLAEELVARIELTGRRPRTTTTGQSPRPGSDRPGGG